MERNPNSLHDCLTSCLASSFAHWLCWSPEPPSSCCVMAFAPSVPPACGFAMTSSSHSSFSLMSSPQRDLFWFYVVVVPLKLTVYVIRLCACFIQHAFIVISLPCCLRECKLLTSRDHVCLWMNKQWSPRSRMTCVLGSSSSPVAHFHFRTTTVYCSVSVSSSLFSPATDLHKLCAHFFLLPNHSIPHHVCVEGDPLANRLFYAVH